MKKICIGGVPEHFNFPILLAREKGWFEEVGIDLIWKNFPGGSGDMKEALRNKELDVSILLTEGIVADIINGNSSKIISGYVKTSLIWGIYTAGSNKLISKEDFFKTKIAISRKGSGSHLMPIVHAMMKEQSIEESQFMEVGDMEGGIHSLNTGDASIFYWEKFTSKPYVENGTLKKIGEFVSPWPCFMIAATNQLIIQEPKLLKDFLQVVYRVNDYFMNLKNASNLVATNYNLLLKDAQRWFHATEWFTNGWVSNKMLEGVLFSLKEAGIIQKNTHSEALIWNRSK